MPAVRDFRNDVLPAALIARYEKALATSGADVGAARGAIEDEFMERQREERKELADFLDAKSETPGAPRRPTHSNFGTRKRPT